MKKYKLLCDCTADLPDSYYKEHNIETIFLPIMMDGVTYESSNDFDIKEFYQKMRDGSMPTTSQATPDAYTVFFNKEMENGEYDLLFLSFSSALSGSYNSARLAAEDIMSENPDTKIYVIDSLCASLGEGLLLHKACEVRDKGASIDELKDWIENNRLHIVHDFTVDDLNHLHRGGRVSKATAIIGTLANIKPILHVDNEGRLIAVGKVRGRKKAIQALLENMEQKIGSYRDKNDIVFICHGDCEEDAIAVTEEIKKRFGIEKFLYYYTGATIATHSGPGTLSIFYMGDVR